MQSYRYKYHLCFSQHPDSLPLDKALNDLKRNTNKALAFDSSVSTTTGFPLKFFFTMVGENSKYFSSFAE